MTSLSAAIAIMDEFDRQINFNNLKKSVILLSAVIEALGSPLELYIKSDLITYLYSWYICFSYLRELCNVEMVYMFWYRIRMDNQFPLPACRYGVRRYE
jgi:hypothetical protein